MSYRSQYFYNDQRYVRIDAPKVRGDFDLGGYQITNAQRIDVVGNDDDYTDNADAFLKISGDHEYNYTNVFIPSALQFSGTQTLKQSAFILGAGQLFWANGVIKNDPGSAISLAPFYTLNAGMAFQADAQNIDFGVLSGSTDLFVNTSFEGINGGVLSCPNYTQVQLRGVVGLGAEIGSRVGVLVGSMSVTGSVTKEAAYVANSSTAASSTSFLSGASSNPEGGNWNFYQADTHSNRWNGGQQYRLQVFSGASRTLDKSNHHVDFTRSGNVAVSLPAASNGSQEYVIYKSGNSGTLTVTCAGADRFRASGSPVSKTLTSIYDVLRIISNGSNRWYVSHEGAA